MERFNNHERIALEKLANITFKKKYDFISKVKINQFPEHEKYTFIDFTIFIDRDYLRNNERVNRHMDKETIETIKELSDWDMLLVIGESSYDMKKIIVDLVFYISTSIRRIVDGYYDVVLHFKVEP